MKNGFIESFYDGKALDAYEFFGAHFGEDSTVFRVFAPNAKSITLIGSFNDWNDSSCPLTKDDNGVWSVEVQGVKEWDSYKYHIVGQDGSVVDKADPYAFYSETRPSTASKVVNLDKIKWNDAKWMKNRTKGFDKPISIYEIYAGGWRFDENGNSTYNYLKDNLIPYVKKHGFTHIELMPLNEYPFDGSWGYQATGYFSLTSRYGNPEEFASFVDECHRQNIGIIMDFVPVHFVKDDFGLCKFDGSYLYEYGKDSETQWGSYQFDLGKGSVRSFLGSAASLWLDKYHIDGIRVDAVSNLIFWHGNKDLGINEGALEFIKNFNVLINDKFPSAMMFAEDSSDYALVTTQVKDGGLGFDYKWDLGWMNDTLKYYEKDPLYRYYEHNTITFSMYYFYNERFIMPLSHDENVHGKKTVIDKLFGTYEQKFSQVRNLYAYMFAHPGKKLNFMGNEIASFREFDEKKELDWFLLKYPNHDAFLRYFTDLNNIYTSHPSLYKYDYDYNWFKWIDSDNAKDSIFTFYREDEKEIVICILNCTGNTHEDYTIEVPYAGKYTEILNSEKDIYGGCNYCNYEPLRTKKVDGKHQLHVKVAPFGAIYLHRRKRNVFR